MDPCIVLDIETTGLPNKPRGWAPQIVEIGAIVLTAAGELADTFEAMVQQPREHLTDPRAAFALGLADLTPEKILAEGRDADRLAIRFACWLGAMAERHKVRHLTAFNSQFDFGFLSGAPWCLMATGLRPGEDIMLAAMDTMGPAGALPQWADGTYKWPKSEEAEAFFKARGHDVDYPGIKHRALRDAGTEALIWRAILKERGL